MNKKLVTIGVFVALVIPRASFAADYVVSPSFAGNATLSVALANQVCLSLPDAVASQQPFCVFSSAPSTVTIADHDILISVTSGTSAHITWNTATPSTSQLWYSSDPLTASQSNSVQYVNNADGYTTTHSIDISGIDLKYPHLFEVGGIVQGTSLQITSYQQKI